jgi:hypothetical protein
MTRHSSCLARQRFNIFYLPSAMNPPPFSQTVQERLSVGSFRLRTHPESKAGEQVSDVLSTGRDGRGRNVTDTLALVNPGFSTNSNEHTPQILGWRDLGVSRWLLTQLERRGGETNPGLLQVFARRGLIVLSFLSPRLATSRSFIRIHSSSRSLISFSTHFSQTFHNTLTTRRDSFTALQSPGRSTSHDRPSQKRHPASSL